jgi:hypothetical protein
MEPLAEQLLHDARKRYINRDSLLEACLRNMTRDQLYEMAINYRFIVTEDESIILNLDNSGEDKNMSVQDKIIEAVLARHGE